MVSCNIVFCLVQSLAMNIQYCLQLYLPLSDIVPTWLSLSVDQTYGNTRTGLRTRIWYSVEFLVPVDKKPE